MIRYNYNAQHRPAAPFVILTIRHPHSGVEIGNLPAQIDTAADCTLLPSSIAKQLSLDKIGEVAIGGVGGTVDWMDVHEVLLGIQPLPLRLVEVVAHDGESWVLLGRDVLNGYRLILDGPAAILEIA